MLRLTSRTTALAGMMGSLVCLFGCNKAPEPANAPTASTTPAEATVPAKADCAPSGELNYVCGPKNPEDIIRLADTSWLIVSGMSAQGENPSSGHLYLLDYTTKAYEEWFPGSSPAMNADTKMFGACPGPINTANFSAHGLAIREQSPQKYRLYMTSHGDREAIEVFDIDAAGTRPTIAWIGCVVLPEKTFANSVAILTDGGFVTTKMMDPTIPNPFAPVLTGDITGNVYEWHPGGKVTAIPGTELSGANGIELSPDDRWMYVAALGSREVIRFDRSTKPMAKQSVQVGIRPDNLRWTANGKLYTAGGNFVAPAECANPPCNTGWSVYEIDPGSMQATRVAGADQTAALQGASAALAVGSEIWVGTYSGDRVGYLPKP